MAQPDKIDILTFDVPLFIRLLEYAKEDAKTDMDLHNLADNAISLSKEKEILTMDDYNSLVDSSSVKEAIKNVLEAQKKRDRCLRIADRKFDKPSAYKSGAVVRCRKGEIWKDLKEEFIEKYNLIGNCVTGLDDPYFQRNVCYDATEMAGIVDEDSNEFLTSKEFIEKVNWDENILGIAADNMFEFAYNPNKDIYWAYNIEEDVHYFFTKDKLNENYKDYINVKKEEDTQEENLDPSTFKDTGRAGKSSPYGSGFTKVKEELILEKAKETLRTWFKRKGAPGKTGGWVDCNSPIRKDGEITGYKSCGRQKDEKRSKYPSCRPTASQCNDPGKGKTWGKTK